MKFNFHLPLKALFIALSAFCLAGFICYAQDAESDIPPAYSDHAEQWKLLKDSKIELEPEIVADEAKKKAEIKDASSVKAITRSIDSKNVVFGYHPSYRDGVEFHYRWHALTHIGYCFVDFTATGALQSSSWSARPAAFQTGGDAQLNGVKVIMCLANDNFDSDVLGDVMISPTLRTTVVNNVVSLINSSGLCDGVNLDFEPVPWRSADRSDIKAGLTAFCAELNAALKAMTPPRELSIYVSPTYYSSSYDVEGLEPNIDYLVYSGYPFAGTWSTSAVAVGSVSGMDGNIDYYMQNGMPPEKMVIALPVYGHKWNTSGSGDYGSTVLSSIGSVGYIQAAFDTSIRPSAYTRYYQQGSECPWYKYPASPYVTTTYDDDESIEFKFRMTRSWLGAQYPGRVLRGVAFWELAWMAEETSYDMNTASSVTRTRTYPKIYDLMHEIFTPPGTSVFIIDKFEALDYRWRDPNEGPDDSGDTNSDSSRAIASTPSGTGKPSNSDYCMNIFFDYENTSGNKLFFRHEILADPSFTSTPDINAAKVFVDANTKFIADIYTPSAYSGRTIRMVLMDKDGELEMSPTFSLNSSGWRTISWDITDSANISAYNTSEVPFKDGDGVVDSALGAEKDIAFAGFLIEGGSSGSGNVYIDELRFTHQNPENKNYVINEFRYITNSNEFVEIYGPAGAFPSGFKVIVYDKDNGTTVSKQISLEGQSIPNDNAGYGYFVVGDSGTNVDYSAGFSASADDISNEVPCAIQLYSETTGCVYDSVVYNAYGGLGELIRKQTRGVTQNGYPWTGAFATGTTNGGTQYSAGRYPDGTNTHINGSDFSFQSATPGESNGGSVTIPASFDFSTAPPKAFKTYQAFSVQASAVGASPSGGNVHRCVDTSGGGVMTVIGDASLGSGGVGYSASGEIYIPASTEPAQAIAVGICGRQGSTFFTTSGYEANSSYDSGYMVIYENKSGIGLNNGRSDHPGSFEFMLASNDNADANKVDFLGSKSTTDLGITQGAWTKFYLSIDPSAPSGRQLLLALNDKAAYQGNIPAGAPTSGAFIAGFRENHTDVPASTEGTWIDNLNLNTPFQAVSISQPPTSKSVYVGQSATFTVTASGTGPLTYQWKKGGGDITGENGPSYTIPSAQLTDAGSYTCEVKNIFTSLVSDPATLTVTEYTPTPSPTPSFTPSPTPSPTPTSTPSPTPPPVFSPTPSFTPTPTPALTPTPTKSPTPTPSLTPTYTPSPTPSPTPTPALSPTPTKTPTPTPTKSPTPTQTPTPTPTAIGAIYNEPYNTQNDWQCWLGGSAAPSTYGDWYSGQIRCKFPTTSGWPSPGWTQWLHWNTGHTGVDYALAMSSSNLYVLRARLSANKNVDIPGIRIRAANKDNAWAAQANFEYYPASPAPTGGFPTTTPQYFYIIWQPQGSLTNAYIAIDTWTKIWTGEVYVDDISVYSIPIASVSVDRQEKDITNFSSGWGSGGTQGITIGTTVQFSDLMMSGGNAYHNLGGYVTLNNTMAAGYIYKLRYYWAKSGSNKTDDIRMRVNDAYNGATDSEFIFVDQDSVINNLSTTAKEYILYHYATNPRLTGTGDLAVWADGLANVQNANNAGRILSRIIIEKVTLPPLN